MNRDDLETRLRIGLALVKFFAWVRGTELTYLEAADVLDEIAQQKTREARR